MDMFLSGSCVVRASSGREMKRLTSKIVCWEEFESIMVKLLSFVGCPGITPAPDSELRAALEDQMPAAAGAKYFEHVQGSDAYRSTTCLGAMKAEHSRLHICQNCAKARNRLVDGLSRGVKRRRMGGGEKAHDIAYYQAKARNLSAKLSYFKAHHIQETVLADVETSMDLLNAVKVAQLEISKQESWSPKMVKLVGNECVHKLGQSLEALSDDVSKQMKEIDESTRIFKKFQRMQEEMRLQKANKTRIKWPAMLLNISIAIYQRSRSTYSMMKGFGALQLPSERLMRMYTSAGMHSSEVDLVFLRKEVKQMEEFARRTKHRHAKHPRYFKKGHITVDEMKIRANCCLSKSTGDWCGFAEDFDTISKLCKSYEVKTDISRVPATHVTATLWSSFILPYQILVSVRATTKDICGTEICTIINEAFLAINAVGLDAPLCILDAASSNKNAVENHFKEGYGPTGMKMLFIYDPTHVYKRYFSLYLFVLILFTHRLIFSVLGFTNFSPAGHNG